MQNGKMINLRRVVFPVFVAVFFTACTAVGPNYQRPAIETPENWRIEYSQAVAVANVSWWAQFGDPTLNELIETALRENRDIQAAAARVDQFIGSLQTTRSQFFPQIDTTRKRAVIAPQNVGGLPSRRALTRISRSIEGHSVRHGRSTFSAGSDVRARLRKRRYLRASRAAGVLFFRS